MKDKFLLGKENIRKYVKYLVRECKKVKKIVIDIEKVDASSYGRNYETGVDYFMEFLNSRSIYNDYWRMCFDVIDAIHDYMDRHPDMKELLKDIVPKRETFQI